MFTSKIFWMNMLTYFTYSASVIASSMVTTKIRQTYKSKYVYFYK